MIQKLRIRFVTLAMSALLAVLLVLLGGINITNYSGIVSEADRVLTTVSKIPELSSKNRNPLGKGVNGLFGQLSPEAHYNNRLFSVVLAPDGTVLETDLKSNALVEASEAADLAARVFAKASDTGFMSIYRFRKQNDGGTSLQILEIPVSDVICEAAESFQGLAQTQGKTLFVSVEPLLSMEADEKSLRQLICILLDNALKYSPEGSSIQLALQQHSRQLKLTVINTSSLPLPEGNADILFERFYRADASRNSRTGGHGIGLSIAKAIVTAHNGSIHASVLHQTQLQITALFPQHHPAPERRRLFPF